MKDVSVIYNEKLKRYTLYVDGKVALNCSYGNKPILQQMCEKLGYENRRYNITMGQGLENRRDGTRNRVDKDPANPQ